MGAVIFKIYNYVHESIKLSTSVYKYRAGKWYGLFLNNYKKYFF